MWSLEGHSFIAGLALILPSDTNRAVCRSALQRPASAPMEIVIISGLSVFGYNHLSIAVNIRTCLIVVSIKYIAILVTFAMVAAISQPVKITILILIRAGKHPIVLIISGLCFIFFSVLYRIICIADGHEDEVLHAFSAAPALTFSVIEDPLLTLLPFTKLCSATYPLAVLELYTYTIVTLKLSNLFFAEVSLKPTTSGTFTRVSLVVGGAVTVINTIGGNVIVNVKESRIAVSREMAQKIMI